MRGNQTRVGLDSEQEGNGMCCRTEEPRNTSTYFPECGITNSRQGSEKPIGMLIFICQGMKYRSWYFMFQL